MTRLTPVFVAALLLLAPPAQASWAHTHLSRAWSGGLSALEVEQLEAEIEAADPKTADGWWTLLLLAIHHDAAGDTGGACEIVARFDGLARAGRDLRVKALRAGCLLAAGDLDGAEALAKAAGRAAAATEPIDGSGILNRAQAVEAGVALARWRARPHDDDLRARAQKAVAAWEHAARERGDGQGMVEAMAWRADLER